MNILLLIVFGAIVGWLAGFFVSKKGGIAMNIVIGIVGAFLGGFLFNLFGATGVTGFNLYSILVGVVGSVVLVSLIHAFD